MAENFHDATAQLQGDQWDGVMNYDGFTFPLRFWMNGYSEVVPAIDEPLTDSNWSTESLVAMWRGRLGAIPWAIAKQQYNMLGTHDTDRIRSAVKENDALHRLAVAIQLTFPGIPALYYGDEVGMVDLPCLKSRGCMIWDETRWNKPLRDFYRDLIHLRRNSSALQRGGFQILAAEADTVAYQRESADERLIVIAHRAKTPRPAGALPVAHGGIADGTSFVDRATGDHYVVREGALSLPPVAQGAIILQQR
jgi:alpha-glucosidase